MTSPKAIALIALAACAFDATGQTGTSPQYLYLWTAAADKTQPDFLAVLDVTESRGATDGW